MRRIYIILALTFVLVISSLFMVGCGSKSINVSDNLSDVRFGVYDGKNSSIIATIIHGERENPYSPDGFANPRINFAIVSVSFSQKRLEESFKFELTDGDKTYSGTLEKSPFSNEYLADLGNLITSNEVSLTVITEDEQINLSLTNKSLNWTIDSSKALEIGENALKQEIKNLQNQGSCEYYLKIISDNKSNFGSYFWAFTVISETGSKHNVVFSPYSDTILVKN